MQRILEGLVLGGFWLIWAQYGYYLSEWEKRWLLWFMQVPVLSQTSDVGFSLRFNFGNARTSSQQIRWLIKKICSHCYLFYGCLQNCHFSWENQWDVRVKYVLILVMWPQLGFYSCPITLYGHWLNGMLVVASQRRGCHSTHPEGVKNCKENQLQHRRTFSRVWQTMIHVTCYS